MTEPTKVNEESTAAPGLVRIEAAHLTGVRCDFEKKPPAKYLPLDGSTAEPQTLPLNSGFHERSGRPLSETRAAERP